MGDLLLSFTFEVLGEAVPQPRPKARRIGNGIQIYTPSNTRVREYKQSVRDAFLSCVEDLSSQEKTKIANLIERESLFIDISIDYILKRPQHMIKKDVSFDEIIHMKKPDLDNFLKGTLDALTGVAWLDDSKVAMIRATKCYSKIVLGGKSGRKMIAEPGRQVIQINYFSLS